MNVHHQRTLWAMMLLSCILYIANAQLASDPLLNEDTRAGVVHAAEVCIGERAVEMFTALRPFVVADPTSETSQMASDYYLIQFFNQYIGDIDIDICDAVRRAVRTTRFRIGDKNFVPLSSMKSRIEEICHSHTFQLSPTDYYSSLDRIPLCLRRMISHVMDNVFSHR